MGRRTILVTMPVRTPCRVKSTERSPSRWKSCTTTSIGVSALTQIGVYPESRNQQRITGQGEGEWRTSSTQGFKLTQLTSTARSSWNPFASARVRIGGAGAGRESSSTALPTCGPRVVLCVKWQGVSGVTSFDSRFFSVGARAGQHASKRWGKGVLTESGLEL